MLCPQQAAGGDWSAVEPRMVLTGNHQSHHGGQLAMEPLVSMTGRLGTDVEHRTSRHGNDYVTFRLATSQRVQRDGEWTDGDTTWMSVRCYRHLAVNVHYSLQKGDPVIVVGRLRVETWTNDAGVQRESIVLNANAVGHDLTRGTSRFSRAERRQQTEPPSAGRLEGEVMDPETGEIFDMSASEPVHEAHTETFSHESTSEEARLGQ